MAVQIVFEVVTESLHIRPTHLAHLAHSLGSFADPKGISHPHMLVIDGNAPPTPHDGDYPVPVRQNEEVMIWLEDSGRRANIAMAPVRFLGHTWAPGPQPSQGQPLTVGLMDSEDPPISQVSFAQEHVHLHTLGYTGHSHTPAWADTPPPTPSSVFWTGVEASNDVGVQAPRVFHPYLRFNTNDNEGLLTYGLEFAVTMDGDPPVYFWFDPHILIGSSS